jgi:hypothetical protein
VVSFLHSAAIAHYTGREIARFDFFPRGDDAERLIDRLRSRGYHPVFVFDQQNEGVQFKLTLQGTRYERIEWPARANFMLPLSSTVWYVDETDRERPREQIPPIDLVR